MNIELTFQFLQVEHRLLQACTLIPPSLCTACPSSGLVYLGLQLQAVLSGPLLHETVDVVCVGHCGWIGDHCWIKLHFTKLNCYTLAATVGSRNSL